MEEAVARSQFTGMVNKRVKTPEETRALMVELEDKAKKMEEITGETIEEGHYKSVIAGMIDLETLKQTAEYQEGGLDKFKRQVMEFVNLVMSGDGRGGDGGALPEQPATLVLEAGAQRRGGAARAHHLGDQAR